MEANGPSALASPQGRRVLVAVVTGRAGARIQAWRTRYDQQEANRIPPHATLCYWATGYPLDALGRQVRHAFRDPLSLELGAVKEFGGIQRTLYLELLGTERLDDARRALYDGTHLDLGPLNEWPWHVTCVRDANGRDVSRLRAAAAELPQGEAWTLDTIACLELRGARYLPVATWRVP